MKSSRRGSRSPHRGASKPYQTRQRPGLTDTPTSLRNFSFWRRSASKRSMKSPDVRKTRTIRRSTGSTLEMDVAGKRVRQKTGMPSGGNKRRGKEAPLASARIPINSARNPWRPKSPTIPSASGNSLVAPLLLDVRAPNRGIAEKQNQIAHLGQERAIMKISFAVWLRYNSLIPRVPLLQLWILLSPAFVHRLGETTAAGAVLPLSLGVAWLCDTFVSRSGCSRHHGHWARGVGLDWACCTAIMRSRRSPQ